ncbi:deoxyribonuclease IV [Buchnera aphidicola]|uniref:deoxyribonuclease IV n=1 Tax=Buchnera aphidicola TaxID=9 RepID=UPI0022374120|nr:deoxyribonuclease IV [Buchnera aphidicola]MCW5197635.1 deoxyribonuclease IV [Buchnera aphidicola (Chaitophorus viminalis)]
MKYVGSHVSISKGILFAIKESYCLKSTAIGFFIKNPLRWKVPNITEKMIKDFKKTCKKYNYSSKQILPHSGFLINLGHPDSCLLNKSRNSLLEEVIRCEDLGLRYLNFHPGSHLNKISKVKCLERISDSINFILSKTKKLILVVENTAGQGTNLGYNFDQLSIIINGVENKKRIGICLDTCHLFASGYDLRTKKNYIKTFDSFDKKIGFNYLKGLHLNDSKNILGSRKDRHENLGLGYIGKNCFKWIMKDYRFKKKPIILETINKNLWLEEISWLQSKDII